METMSLTYAITDTDGDTTWVEPAENAITQQQIRSLRREAEQAGDYDQVAICDVALVGVAHGHTVEVSGRTWTQDEARAECARVSNEAAAQHD